MSNRELTIVAIKIFALYLLVQSIYLFTNIGYINFASEAMGEKWFLLIPTLMIAGMLLLFFSLWKLSNNVITSLLKPTEDKTDFKLDQIFILQLVGAYLLVVGLLSIVQGLIQLYYVTIWMGAEYDRYAYKPEIPSQTIYFIIANIIKTIIGITLLIRSNGWVKLFHKFRKLGAEK